MTKHLFLMLFMSIAICGCATSYQSNGFTGGYSETQLAPDVIRVNFAGNGYTSPERAQDFALLRASDLTLAHGFTHFAIVNEADTMAQSSFTTPGQAYSTGYVTAYGNNAFYNGSTTYVPGQTFVFNKPRSGLLIRCFTGQPKGIYAFDARFLENSLRQKYNIHSSGPTANRAAIGMY